jgi:hypothetical protein
MAGGVVAPFVLSAPSASAATPPLTAAQQLCLQAYGGSFSAPSNASYQCGNLPASGVNLKPAEQQCVHAYDGRFISASTASYSCSLPPSG